jgi:hypothetical protein
MTIRQLFFILTYLVINNSLCFAETALPALGNGYALDRGVIGSSQATFVGGTLSGQIYNRAAILTQVESTNIRGTITVDPAHVGKKAELIAAVIYTLATGQRALFSLTKSAEGTITPVTWDGSINGLSVFENVTLSQNQELAMYQGVLPSPGQLSVFFGYSVFNADGTTTLVYNSQPIQIQVNAHQAAGTPTDNQGNTETPTPPTDNQGSDGTTTPLKTFLASYDFKPNPNGFSFENYSNDANATNDLTTEDMISLFGQAKVCRSPEGACILTAAARQWMEKEIKGMNGGHCEGMAVVSLRLRQGLLFKGKKSPVDFQPGANTTFDLSKDAIRNYIAHYFVTQSLDPVATATSNLLEKTPAESLQLLIDSMKQGLNNAYSMGIFEPGYKGGHAITPYAVEQKTDDEFWVYIYDNNYPNDGNRVIKINRTANTWVYEGAATKPGEPASTYRGDATTKTLGLTPQNLREGPFTCPFCNNDGSTRDAGDNTVEFSLVGEGKLLIQLSDGRRVGYDFDVGKEVNEIDGVKRFHPRHGLGKDIPPTYEIPIPSDNSLINVFISGKDADQEVDADLTMTGPGYMVGFEGISLDPDEMLMMKIRPDGHQMSFTASQDAETPSVFLAQDPEDDMSPSYIFEVGGAELEANRTMLFTLEGDSLYITDDDGNEDQYDLSITRIDDVGDNHFKKDNVAVGGNANARIKFDQWDGNQGKLNFYADDEGDGFDDEIPMELEDED